jgi:hypothetical protein
MKSKFTLFSIFLMSLFLVTPAMLLAQSTTGDAAGRKPSKSETIRLFNGKDLTNWDFNLRDASVDPATVFTIKNGVINISGNPFGYMRTKETYSDYKLHVEWRWPQEATNSGVFIHGQLPDAIWLECIECQLKAGSAGDFVCMNGADMKEHTNKAVSSIKKMAESSEKPTGEWNTMEVVCNGSSIEVYINGVLQNKGTDLNISSGHICLQSEGKDVEFRNVFLTGLK